ncbi:MAG: hypothetical protein KAH32_08500, partial [Chlamydiia bacterium]|nr:hypothetical protein [Chlamydiia bacterium]
MSEILKNAVTGTYPNYQIDYANVLLSKGSLPNVLNPHVVLDISGDVNLTWTDNSGMGNSVESDSIMYVVYCPDLKDATFLNQGGALRSDEAHTIALPTSYMSHDVHVFVSMISSDGRDLSNSVYLGSLLV